MRSVLKVGPPSAIGAPMIAAPGGGSTAIGAPDPQGAADVQSSPAAPMVQTGWHDAGDQPIDIDQVSAMRSAIASGHYPLVPAKIGDAMIAAGILLQSGMVGGSGVSATR